MPRPATTAPITRITSSGSDRRRRSTCRSSAEPGPPAANIGTFPAARPGIVWAWNRGVPDAISPCSLVGPCDLSARRLGLLAGLYLGAWHEPLVLSPARRHGLDVAAAAGDPKLEHPARTPPIPPHQRAGQLRLVPADPGRRCDHLRRHGGALRGGGVALLPALSAAP